MSVSDAAIALFKPLTPARHHDLVFGALADDSTIWSCLAVIGALEDLKDALFDLDKASLEGRSQCFRACLVMHAQPCGEHS